MKASKETFAIVLILMTILFLMQGMVYSQPVIIGIKGGISVPELSGGSTPQSTGYTSRLAPNFGAYINYGINSTWTLKAEVLFSGQGGKRNGMQAISSDNFADMPLPPNTDLYANFNNETIINYLEIPLLVGYTINGQNTSISEYIDAGPYLGILLNAKTVTSGNSNLYLDQAGTMPLSVDGYPVPSQNFNSETAITSSVKTLNVGIALGIGINLNIGYGVLDFKLRGVYGFIPIQSDNSSGSNNTGALYFTIGYGIHV
jgi:hypothetical protein